MFNLINVLVLMSILRWHWYIELSIAQPPPIQIVCITITSHIRVYLKSDETFNLIDWIEVKYGMVKSAYRLPLWLADYGDKTFSYSFVPAVYTHRRLEIFPTCWLSSGLSIDEYIKSIYKLMKNILNKKKKRARALPLRVDSALKCPKYRLTQP